MSRQLNNVVKLEFPEAIVGDGVYSLFLYRNDGKSFEIQIDPCKFDWEANQGNPECFEMYEETIWRYDMTEVFELPVREAWKITWRTLRFAKRVFQDAGFKLDEMDDLRDDFRQWATKVCKAA